MTHRVRRKLISTKFKINSTLCKIFFEPWMEYLPGFWAWNVGFAVGKGNRQINDWYKKRKNKRYRSLNNKLTGLEGFKTISLGFKTVLDMRWRIPPGDSIILDCTSGDPERQFKTWKHWHRHHPEWTIDEVKKEFYWTRPPYPDDPIWKEGTIIPKIPENRYASVKGDPYFDCFDISLRDLYNPKSIENNDLQ